MGTLLWLVATILDIFAIGDVMRSSRDLATKVVLIAIILLIPFVGAGLYLFAFRDKSAY
jgi:membrane protein DedA with SNARE-associated domain